MKIIIIMHPVIARLGPFTLYSYGTMVAAAFLFALFMARIEAERKHIKAELVYDLAFYLITGALIGARLYYLLFFSPSIFVKDFFAIFRIWEGGLSIHGGILGGIVSGLLFSKTRKISFWMLADIASPSLILGQAIGRLGCFLNGCCFGVPTTSILGIIFPENSPAHIEFNGLAVHPTQLYEFLLNIIGFLVLWSLRRRIKFDGGLFLVYLMMYSAIRMAVSGLRGDSFYLLNTGLKIEQLFSAAVFLIALLIFIKRQKGNT